MREIYAHDRTVPTAAAGPRWCWPHVRRTAGPPTATTTSRTPTRHRNGPCPGGRATGPSASRTSKRCAVPWPSTRSRRRSHRSAPSMRVSTGMSSLSPRRSGARGQRAGRHRSDHRDRQEAAARPRVLTAGASGIRCREPSVTDDERPCQIPADHHREDGDEALHSGSHRRRYRR